MSAVKGAAQAGKTLTKITQDISHVMEEGCRIALNPNHTQADVDKFWRDLENVGKDSDRQALEEARSQAKEAATRRLMENGMTREEAELWFSDKWKKLVDSAEKVRKELPKVEAAAKSGWLRFVGGVTAIFVAATTFSFLQRDKRAEESREMLATLQYAQEQRRIQQAISEIDFHTMLGGLAVQSAPALPKPVMAIAAQPARVEFTTASGGTQTITTTVGRVYRDSPTSIQREMESSSPSPTQEAANTPDPNSCSVRHCLGGGFHKSITVDAVDGNGNKFGSVNVTY